MTVSTNNTVFPSRERSNCSPLDALFSARLLSILDAIFVRSFVHPIAIDTVRLLFQTPSRGGVTETMEFGLFFFFRSDRATLVVEATDVRVLR